jgi:plasmid stability protein
MKTITIRNIPPRIERAIRQRARAQKTSANKAVIGLLDDHLGSSVSEPAAEYHDLDELAGVWSEREARFFDESLARQRALDKELWK